MLASYRSLLGRPDARSLLFVCALSWLSYSGYGLALILAVHAATRSYATAGAVIAAQAVGAGLLAPVRGRLVDRRGASVLKALGVSHAVSGALLTTALLLDLRALVFVGAALLGMSSPPLIGVARARWTELAGADLARTGHALNAALSDAAALATPALVAGIALATSAAITLAGLVLGAFLASLTLGSQLTATAPDIADPLPTRSALFGVLRESPGLRVLAVCDLFTVAWLAGLDIAVIAIAGRHGIVELGALVLAASAAGSIVMSLLAGGSRLHGAPADRYAIGAVIAACALPLTLLASSLVELALVLVIVGAGFGLLNVALFQIVDDVSPSGRTVETFTWLTTAASIGAAIGASVCGRLAQASSTSPLLLIIGLAVVAAVIAGAQRRTLMSAPTAGRDARYGRRRRR